MERLWHLMRHGKAIDTLRLSDEQALDMLEAGQPIEPTNETREALLKINDGLPGYDEFDSRIRI